MFQAALILALFALAAWLAYANSFDAPFYFDDLPAITGQEQIRAEELSIDALTPAWEVSSRPVANASFALNYALHGFEVRGYRITNLAIHIATGFLLYLVFMKTLALASPARTRRQYQVIAAAAALLWLVHPLHTQSVTYIVQRMNSLAALFFLLALLLYIVGRQQTRRPLQLLAFAGCAVAGLLALESKQNAATLPLFLAFYEWFFLQDAGTAWLHRHRRWLALAVVVLVTGAGAFLFSGLADGLIETLRATYDGYDFTMAERVLTELRVVVHYVSLILYPDPARLHLDYDFALSRSLFQPMTTLWSLLAIAGAFAAACLLARRHRILAFAIFWYLGNLLIESSFIGLDLVFEHRTYLPSMFLFLAFATALYAIPLRKGAFAAFVLALVSIGIFWTHQRNFTWQEPVRFWSDNVAKAPGAVRPRLNLGKALRQAGRIDEAMAQYRAAIALQPGYFKAHYNLANALADLERHTEAISAFREAIRWRPDFAMAHYNLGNSLFALGRFDEAEAEYRRAIEFNSKHYKAHYNLAVILMRTGRPDQAIDFLEQTAALNPGFPQSYFYLGRIYKDKGEREKAIGYLQQALSARPGYPEALALLEELEGTRGQSKGPE